MSMSSSNVRLPHVSAGPFWAPTPVEPRHEWHEIETLLAAPVVARAAPRQRRGIPSFVFVAAALALGGGMLGMTLIGSRSDCGAACHVVTATAGPAGEAPRNIDTTTAAPSLAARHVDTAALAPAPDTAMKEGRSAAEPVLDMTTPAAGAPDSAASDVIPEPAAPLIPHRHHHHHHGVHP